MDAVYLGQFLTCCSVIRVLQFDVGNKLCELLKRPSDMKNIVLMRCMLLDADAQQLVEVSICGKTYSDGIGRTLFPRIVVYAVWI